MHYVKLFLPFGDFNLYNIESFDSIAIQLLFKFKNCDKANFDIYIKKFCDSKNHFTDYRCKKNSVKRKIFKKKKKTYKKRFFNFDFKPSLTEL